MLIAVYFLSCLFFREHELVGDVDLLDAVKIDNADGEPCTVALGRVLRILYDLAGNQLPFGDHLVNDAVSDGDERLATIAVVAHVADDALAVFVDALHQLKAGLGSANLLPARVLIGGQVDERVDALLNPDRAGRAYRKHQTAGLQALDNLGIGESAINRCSAGDDLVGRAVVGREVSDITGDNGGSLPAVIYLAVRLESIDAMDVEHAVERSGVLFAVGVGFAAMAMMPLSCARTMKA